jgi:hypothetical protein
MNGEVYLLFGDPVIHGYPCLQKVANCGRTRRFFQSIEMPGPSMLIAIDCRRVLEVVYDVDAFEPLIKYPHVWVVCISQGLTKTQTVGFPYEVDQCKGVFGGAPETTVCLRGRVAPSKYVTGVWLVGRLHTNCRTWHALNLVQCPTPVRLILGLA